MAIIFQSDFETGDYSDFNAGRQAGGPEISTLHARSGIYSSRAGSNSSFPAVQGLYHNFSPKTDLWLTGHLFFPTGFIMPTPDGRAPHFWRFWFPRESTNPQLDFNVGGSGGGSPSSCCLQLQHFPTGTDGKTVVATSTWNPADNTNRWVKMELHEKVNTPGNADGLMELYVDDALLMSKMGNFIGTSGRTIQQVNFQSNIGGGGTWPAGQWWYLDDVILSTTRLLADAGVLSGGQRRKIWALSMSNVSNREGQYGSVLKTDIRAGVNAIDQWIEDGSLGTLVDAYPEPCKSELTSNQRDEIRNLVLKERG